MELSIPRHGVNELRTYIVGLSGFEFSIAQNIAFSTEVNDKFSLIIGPLAECEVKFLAVSYLILSVVNCGYCAGYGYGYNGTCLPKCPTGTVHNSGVCLPIDCVKGYVKGPDGTCIPECKTN